MDVMKLEKDLKAVEGSINLAKMIAGQLFVDRQGRTISTVGVLE